MLGHLDRFYHVEIYMSNLRSRQCEMEPARKQVVVVGKGNSLWPLDHADKVIRGWRWRRCSGSFTCTSRYAGVAV